MCVCVHSLIHSVEKNLKEHSDKLDEATRTEVEGVLADARTFAGTDSADGEALKAKAAALSAASMKIGQAIYSKKGAEGAADEGAAAAGQEGKAEEPKEAEFKEKK